MSQKGVQAILLKIWQTSQIRFAKPCEVSGSRIADSLLNIKETRPFLGRDRFLKRVTGTLA
jgi:hypothetical protein